MKTRYAIILLGILVSIASCKQKTDPNKQIDEGHVKNDVYSSKEIGWTITIPDNWKVITKEQNETFQKKGLDAMEDMLDEEVDASEVRNLIGFQKDQFNIFQSTSEPFEVEYEGEWEETNAALKELIYYTYMDQNIKVDSTATKIVKVNGLDFRSYEFKIYGPNGDVILNQIMYSRLINGFDFGVNINYNNESYKKEMLDAWLNSKFKKQKLKGKKAN
ncbi:hypothetical protein [Flavivirga eckloniae]|uniref:Uncharacterized protein n=1 Tax=Flavivirga eckloniae TaxID=1803846 RepID=A0A2K9PVD6_9FLAO|nr:hypothetical protein [Flavivirga eckloniae]AUP80778.1 hypothetical protein C1H87_19485 [Flavivirga eckloniae]